MNDGTEALQDALLSRLTTALTGVSLPGITGATNVPVLDHVPDGEAYPYVTVGETDVSDWGDKDEVGSEQSLTIEVFTRYRGKKQARVIARLIYESLHQQTFGVTGHRLVLIRCEQTDYSREPDGLTYSARSRYRALVETPTA